MLDIVKNKRVKEENLTIHTIGSSEGILSSTSSMVGRLLGKNGANS
jgi:hypothetical protein